MCQDKDPHFTLAHHRVSSNSVVGLEHGGSWVQIPSGTQTFFWVDVSTLKDF